MKQGSERCGILNTLPGWLAKAVLSKPQCLWLVPYTYRAACSYLFLDMFSCWISLAQRSKTSGVRTLEFALRIARGNRSVFSITVGEGEFSRLSVASVSLLTKISLWLRWILDGRLLLLYMFLRPRSNTLLSIHSLQFVYSLTIQGPRRIVLLFLPWVPKFASLLFCLTRFAATLNGSQDGTMQQRTAVGQNSEWKAEPNGISIR